MDEKNLKTGTCPKCGSSEVYTTKDTPKRGDRMQLVVSSMEWYFLDTYYCTNCGYFEEHVNENDVKDQNIIAKIKQKWKKVK